MKSAAALLLCCSFGASAAPSEIKAEFQLTNNGIVIGRVHESFVRKEDDTYAISSVSRSEGLLKLVYDEQITLRSSGRVLEKGLQPLRFEERRARDPKRDVEATFDWERGQFQSSFRGETTTLPLPRGTQDRISMMYQFMHLKPAVGSFVFAMSNGRKVERYMYRLVDEVRIATPLGEFDTFHLERVTDTPKDSRAEVWLAKERDNFPVRVVFDDPKGLRIEQSVVALQAR
jgi:hypothetical protein